MDSDTPLVVNLEVTVPHIVFPALRSRAEGMEQADNGQSGESRDSAMVEQVRLLPLGFDQPPIIARDMSERMTHAVKFRLFRLNMPWIGKPLLFQVLRRWKDSRNRREHSEIKEEHEGLYVAETSAFSLEFRSLDHGAESTSADTSGYTQQVPLQAGLNRVVIYLDHEGMPGSYSIDGAES